MKAHSRRHDAPDRKSLHLAELLDYRPDQGMIRLHEQRVVILSAAAMGLLRKELVDTLGRDTARRLLLRLAAPKRLLGLEVALAKEVTQLAPKSPPRPHSEPRKQQKCR